MVSPLVLLIKDPKWAETLLDFGPSTLCPMGRMWPPITPTSKSWKEAGTKSGPFEKSSLAGRTTD